MYVESAPSILCLDLQVEDFELSVKLQCELRPYQREGIAWLAFLRRTGLHGCLADDMGLGKTLQATAIIAGLTCIHSMSQLLNVSITRPKYTWGQVCEPSLLT